MFMTAPKKSNHIKIKADRIIMISLKPVTMEHEDILGLENTQGKMPLTTMSMSGQELHLCELAKKVSSYPNILFMNLR